MKQPTTPDERAEVETETRQFHDVMDEMLPALNAARARLGLAALRRPLDLFDRADRVLCAVSQAFDFTADSLPSNFHYVGPLLDAPGWSRPWQAPWPAGSGRPRILATCSSGDQGQTELVQRVIGAMGAVDADVVATTGPYVNIADLRAPENVRLIHSAPHDVVMKEVSVVVSQGGHGTVSRALLNGLPQLVLPKGRDQHGNAARVEAKGVGLHLPDSASEREIAAAVTRLIVEPHFAAAARPLGASIRAEIDACSLVHQMEAMMAGHEHRLRSQASDD